jgi:hypothetical protein
VWPRETHNTIVACAPKFDSSKLDLAHGFHYLHGLNRDEIGRWMRMNCLFAPMWQVLQALVSLPKATANLVLLLAPTAFISSSTAGSILALIMSATGMPSWVGNSLQAFRDLVNFIGREIPVILFAREPQLGMAKLRRGHEFAKT